MTPTPPQTIVEPDKKNTALNVDVQSLMCYIYNRFILIVHHYPINLESSPTHGTGYGHYIRIGINIHRNT